MVRVRKNNEWVCEGREIEGGAGRPAPEWCHAYPPLLGLMVWSFQAHGPGLFTPFYRFSSRSFLKGGFLYLSLLLVFCDPFSACQFLLLRLYIFLVVHGDYRLKLKNNPKYRRLTRLLLCLTLYLSRSVRVFCYFFLCNFLAFIWILGNGCAEFIWVELFLIAKLVWWIMESCYCFDLCKDGFQPVVDPIVLAGEMTMFWLSDLWTWLWSFPGSFVDFSKARIDLKFTGSF